MSCVTTEIIDISITDDLTEPDKDDDIKAMAKTAAVEDDEDDGPPVELPQHVTEARQQLSYDFESLAWDSAHHRNEQEIYCYCGENGDW